MTDTPKAIKRGTIHLLSEAAVRNAKPLDDGKPNRLLDGGGLQLVVEPNGRKWWRMRFTYAGKENTLSLGDYPEIGTKAARAKASAMRGQVTDGIDPSTQRKVIEAERRSKAMALTFAGAFERWHAVKSKGWSEDYIKHTRDMMARDVLPAIGRRKAEDVTPVQITHLLRKVEERGSVASAHRLRGFISQVYRFAIAEGRLDHDPAQHIGQALEKVGKGKHRPAITDPVRFGELLRAIDTYGGYTTRQVLKMQALAFLRSAEVNGMRWDEIDFERAMWTVPAARMKRKKDGKLNGDPHLVPLSRQALAILAEMKPVSGMFDFVFPGEAPAKPVSRLTTWAAIRALGFKDHCPHGFRASARTMLDEVLGIQEKVIEVQQDHAVKDLNGRAYNRTEFMKQRIEMMQTWADYMDRLRTSGG